MLPLMGCDRHVATCFVLLFSAISPALSQFAGLFSFKFICFVSLSSSIRNSKSQKSHDDVARKRSSAVRQFNRKGGLMLHDSHSLTQGHMFIRFQT